jgi:hypothetical protein
VITNTQQQRRGSRMSHTLIIPPNVKLLRHHATRRSRAARFLLLLAFIVQAKIAAIKIHAHTKVHLLPRLKLLFHNPLNRPRMKDLEPNWDDSRW